MSEPKVFRIVLLIVIFGLWVPLCRAETLADPAAGAVLVDWRDRLARYVDVSEMGEEYFSRLIEELEVFEEQPMDLNEATIEQLTSIPFISYELAQEMVNYRQRYEGFKHIGELRLIYGVDEDLYHCLLPFLRVEKEGQPSRSRRNQKLYHQLTWQTQHCISPQAGYMDRSADRIASNKIYAGDAWQHTGRYSLRYGEHYKAGIIWDKDAGETWQRGHWSGYLSWENSRGWVRQLCLGHYRVNMGSGLLLSQQFSLGKNLLGNTMFGRYTRISPNTSRDEYNYCQGVAMLLRPSSHWQIIPFVSFKPLGGTLVRDTLTAIVTDGMFRTEREADKRRQAWMSLYGLHVMHRREWWQVGVNGLYTYLNKTYSRPYRLYNENYFRGHRLAQLSAEYRVHLFGVDLMGETAWSDNGGYATLCSLQRRWDNDWAAMLLYRDYGEDYLQLHGNTFGESSDLQAERGIYAQVSGPLARRVTMTLAADYFRFSHAKYGLDLPSRGYEFSARIDYRSAHETIEAYLRYRLKNKAKNNTTGQFDFMDTERYFRHVADGSVIYRPLPWLRSKTAVQGKLYCSELRGTSLGMGVSQEISLTHRWADLSLQCTWFDSDDYDTRLYLSERQLRYGFGIPMLYGEGIRYNACLTLRLPRDLRLSAKYVCASYADRAVIGSGLEAVEGNLRQDLWMVASWRF